jgi:hypothetical protein
VVAGHQDIGMAAVVVEQRAVARDGDLEAGVGVGVEPPQQLAEVDRRAGALGAVPEEQQPRLGAGQGAVAATASRRSAAGSGAST